jgi:hypothetical protein
MPLNAPTVRFWNVVSGGNGAIAQSGLQGTSNGNGPRVQPVGSGETIPYWDFGAVQANNWDVKVGLIGFEGNTAQSIRFWMQDPTYVVGGSTAGDFNDPNHAWVVRYSVRGAYVDPTTFTDQQIMTDGSNFVGWFNLPLSPTDPGIDMDSLINANKNDNTPPTPPHLIQATQVPNTPYMINAFLYVAFKPSVNVYAGEYLGFGTRATYVYPTGP